MEFEYAYAVLNFASMDETDYELQIKGEYIHIESTDAEVSIKLNEKSNDAIPMNAKDKLVAPFNRIYITTTTATTFTLFIASDRNIVLDSNEINVDTITSVEKTSAAAYGRISVTATAAPADLIKAASTTRKAITLSIVSGGPLYIGNNNAVIPTTGLVLQNLGGITIDKYTGALYGCVTAGTCIVTYFEEG